MDAEDAFAFRPSAHWRGSAASAVFAWHQVRATAATPASPDCTTFLTPGMLAILAASNVLSLPPHTGHSLSAAQSIPGNVQSIEYFCLPVTLSAVFSLLSG